MLGQLLCQMCTCCGLASQKCVFSLVAVYAWPCLLTVCAYVCVVAQLWMSERLWADECYSNDFQPGGMYNDCEVVEKIEMMIWLKKTIITIFTFIWWIVLKKSILKQFKWKCLGRDRWRWKSCFWAHLTGPSGYWQQDTAESAQFAWSGSSELSLNHWSSGVELITADYTHPSTLKPQLRPSESKQAENNDIILGKVLDESKLRERKCHHKRVI